MLILAPRSSLFSWRLINLSMVKLASARECRLYGPRLSRNRAEYMNAGLYLFSTVVLVAGHVALLSSWQPKSGLVLLLIALALIAAVNLHDLMAHLAGVDYRVSLVEHDPQLALVEFSVPVFQAVGSFLSFIAIILIFSQEEKGYIYGYKRERGVMNLLIAGAVFWLTGSIQNSCQIYERSDGHVQILQQSVHLPFLIASSLFVAGAIINLHQISLHRSHRGLELLGRTWIWLGISGSIALVIGGVANVVKVFKMQQTGGLRLEKLRGGAQERLLRHREAQPILHQEDNSSRHKFLLQQNPPPDDVDVHVDTPYKDVLIHGVRPKCSPHKKIRTKNSLVFSIPTTKYIQEEAEFVQQTLPKAKMLAYYSRSKKCNPAERAPNDDEMTTRKSDDDNQNNETSTEEEEEEEEEETPTEEQTEAEQTKPQQNDGEQEEMTIASTTEPNSTTGKNRLSSI
ncbi:hypothetical protein V2J09_015518 [Rumex salicifolius]